METKSSCSVTKLIVFTIIVLLITGVSLYKMQTLTRKAEQAALTSFASSLTAINSENALLNKVSTKKLVQKIKNCSDITKLLPAGLPKGYSIVSKQVAAGKSVSCELKAKNMQAIFTVTGVS